MSRATKLRDWVFGMTPSASGTQVPADAAKEYYKYTTFTGNALFDEWFRNKTELPQERQQRRVLYDRIDTDLISSVLDVYAEDATQFNLKENATIWIESKNKEVKKVLTELLRKLEIEDMAYPIARGIAKYGEEFDQFTYSEKGIFTWETVDKLLYKVKDEKNGSLLGYSFESDESNKYSLPWDFVQFILIGKNRDRNYGSSMLDPIVKMNARLNMMEDAATVYRILRATDQDVYQVDITGLTPMQASMRMKNMQDIIKKQKYVTENKDQIQENFKPPGSATGDIFIPTVQGREDTMERLSSPSRGQDVYDLEYFLRRFCSVSRVPPEYLGLDFSGGITFESNRSLVQQDVKYARMVKKLQRAFLRGILKACEIELCFHNIDPNAEENKFKLAGDPISFLDELQRQELYEARIGVIESFTRVSRDLGLESEEWARYLLATFGGFTSEMLDLMYADQEDDEEDEEESTTTNVHLSEDKKKKLKKEYKDNKKLQKKIQEASDKAHDIIESVSKEKSGTMLAGQVTELKNWSSDVSKIKNGIQSPDSSFEKVKRLREELSKYMTGDYRAIKGDVA